MDTQSVTKWLVIAAGVLMWIGTVILAFYGVLPGSLGLVALGLVPILGCYLWISDDLRSRRTDPYRPTRPQAMVEQEGDAPSREEYMRPKPITRNDFRF